MTVVGAFLGALVGILVSFALFIVFNFFVYFVIVVIALVGLFELTKALKKHRSTFVSNIASAVKFTFLLAGIAGFVYFLSEEGNYEDSDFYVLIAIVLFFIPVYAVLTPLRTVWKDSLLYNKIVKPLDGLKGYFRRTVD